MVSLKGNRPIIADTIVASIASAVLVFRMFQGLCLDVQLSVDPIGHIEQEDNAREFVGDLLLEHATVPQPVPPPLELLAHKHN